MLAINEILHQSGLLLRRQPSLLVPVLIGALAARFLVNPLGSGAIAFWLFDLALTAGLLSMIRTFHMGEKGAWDAFFIGVGRFFPALLAGSMVLLALVLLTLLPVVTWLKNTVGMVDPQILMHGQMPTEAQIAMLTKWLLAIGIWALPWGVALFFLAAWKQAVVAQGLSWLKAWKASATFARTHFWRLSGLLTLEAIGVVVGTGMMAVPEPVIAELGSLLALLVNAYFTVALTIAFIGPPPKGEQVDAAA